MIRYNERFLCAQDYELWSRICNGENIRVIPKVGIKYRTHKQQISNKKKEIQYGFSKEIFERNLKKIGCDSNIDFLNTLLILGGKENITLENYTEISNYIDELIDKQTYFKKSKMKKIFYNRFFHLILKSKILKKEKKKIIKNKKMIRKIVKIYNLKYILNYMLLKLRYIKI